MGILRSAAVVGSAVIFLAAAVPTLAQSGPQFSVYPSFSAKFDADGEKFSLISSVVVYNITSEVYSEVSFKQTYPEGVTVRETYQRDAGSEKTGEQSSARRVENNTFYASVPLYKPRQYVVIFNELNLARRLDEITFPGMEITYTNTSGETLTTTLQDSTYDLFIYSNVVGHLKRFLKKHNNIMFDFGKAVPERTEWEFAPIVASARGRFPTGIIGTFPGEDQYNGFFRVRTGAPGNNLQILVVYHESSKKERITDRDSLMSKLRDYLRWCGEFEFIEDGLQVKEGKWKKYKYAWSLDGRWRDTIPDRLGEGSFKAKVFFAPREDVEYFVLGLTHGRDLGPEGSVTPNPEQETKLMKEMDALFETFRSYIVPLSYERR